MKDLISDMNLDIDPDQMDDILGAMNKPDEPEGDKKDADKKDEEKKDWDYFNNLTK